MSSIGSRTGRPATSRSELRDARPPRISETSQLVPPMSMATASRVPPATTAATPPAGPDSTSRAGCADASPALQRPPLDCISSGSGSARSL